MIYYIFVIQAKRKARVRNLSDSSHPVSARRAQTHWLAGHDSNQHKAFKAVALLAAHI
jgi:hypothetical protein